MSNVCRNKMFNGTWSGFGSTPTLTSGSMHQLVNLPGSVEDYNHQWKGQCFIFTSLLHCAWLILTMNKESSESLHLHHLFILRLQWIVRKDGWSGWNDDSLGSIDSFHLTWHEYTLSPALAIGPGVLCLPTKHEEDKAKCHRDINLEWISSNELIVHIVKAWPLTSITRLKAESDIIGRPPGWWPSVAIGGEDGVEVEVKLS